MNIVINPGSGPVREAAERNAEQNIAQFVADLAERRITATFSRRPEADYGEGRYAFTVIAEGGVPAEVQMPGLPLAEVRWLGQDQDIWQFPRLYVDDSSWIWFFALNCFNAEDAPSLQPNGTVVGGEPYVFTRVTFDGKGGASNG